MERVVEVRRRRESVDEVTFRVTSSVELTREELSTIAVLTKVA